MRIERIRTDHVRKELEHGLKHHWWAAHHEYRWRQGKGPCRRPESGDLCRVPPPRPMPAIGRVDSSSGPRDQVLLQQDQIVVATPRSRISRTVLIASSNGFDPAAAAPLERGLPGYTLRLN
jgi:hypothetical protein